MLKFTSQERPYMCTHLRRFQQPAAELQTLNVVAPCEVARGNRSHPVSAATGACVRRGTPIHAPCAGSLRRGGEQGRVHTF